MTLLKLIEILQRKANQLPITHETEVEVIVVTKEGMLLVVDVEQQTAAMKSALKLFK